MFNVTLVNLASDAQSANADLGSSKLGTLTADELTALLENFRGLDSVQNLEAEPQIEIGTRREKYFVRTGQKRLYLYNARHSEEPAQTLTAAEIVAELDGTAAAARTAASIVPDVPPAEEASVLVELVPPPAPSPGLQLTLVVIACVLAGYLVYSTFWATEREASSPLSRIADPAELATGRESLLGVYLTGSEPGNHGIVVQADGTLKLFQINAQVAPSVIYSTYRLGRRGARLALATDQPGGTIEAPDRDTLIYCSETYKRIP